MMFFRFKLELGLRGFLSFDSKSKNIYHLFADLDELLVQ